MLLILNLSPTILKMISHKPLKSKLVLKIIFNVVIAEIVKELNHGN